MAKKAYRVEGKFYAKNMWYPFKKEIVSSSKVKAKEKVLSIIGSNHRVKRKKVEIKEVKELSPEEVEDPVVKYLIEN
ncbi:MAG: 50S ribosomal protein L18a [Thermoplasmata archaeon]|jgi:large subunit ribosomal protein LX|nr:MAG: 50S ribosomal protein L18a [Thermoplasmata archaeon]RLF64690.1 MAG: 50S ribosomal protein L18a [Thermoplasmata archaeon]